MRPARSLPHPALRFEDSYHRELAIPALARHLGYVETFSDHDERFTSSFDSIGLLHRERPTFVEVKLTFAAAEADHVARKLQQGFRALGDLADTSVFAAALRAACPAGTMPTVGIIASRYSESGLTKLLSVLESASRELHFAWVVWRCGPDDFAELAADFQRLTMPRPAGIMPPPIPPTTSNRRKAPPLAAHMAALTDTAAKQLFEAAIAALGERGARWMSRSTYVSGTAGGVFVRLYSTSSKEPGLAIGIDKNRWPIAQAIGFHQESEGAFGHPIFRIQNQSELDALVALVDAGTTLPDRPHVDPEGVRGK
jgi:hypothetical protein